MVTEPQASSQEITFAYEGRELCFRSVDDSDLILNLMREKGTFYEKDVLERVKSSLNKRGSAGVALDIGSFIGTHAVYFSMFCGCERVYAFEANPRTFPVLQYNIERNELESAIFPNNMALGSKPGAANITPGVDSNLGSSEVAFVDGGNIVVSTVDEQVGCIQPEIRALSLIKIDVEGAELEVLTGAKKTLAAYRPVLCIEVHTRENLTTVLEMLRDHSYWIVDCRGRSPTYVIEPTNAFGWHRFLVNQLWLVRASLSSRRAKRFFRKLTRLLITDK